MKTPIDDAPAFDLTEVSDIPDHVHELSLDDPSLYINRELSWLEFNQRVIEEALDRKHPLIERVKFLSISCNNLDEFIMIRVSGLQQKVAVGLRDLSPDGRTPVEQLTDVRDRVLPMMRQQSRIWLDDILPALTGRSITVCNWRDLDKEQRKAMRGYFDREVFPVLTPLAIDPSHPFPHISNLSLNLALILQDPAAGDRLARMKVPGVLPRLVPCPPPSAGNAPRSADTEPGAAPLYFVWLEQLVTANIGTLFPGVDVIEAHPFRVTRNADMEIQEDEASDLLQTIEQGLRQRHFGDVARVEINPNMPTRLRELLINNLPVDPGDVFEVSGPLGLSNLTELMRVARPELKDPPLVPAIPPDLTTAVETMRSDDFFAAIGRRDILMHHPYDSFAPVVSLIESSAKDHSVLAIKQTLYRVGSRSPIVHALAQARDEDTQVAVLVELKARFDEENNIEWARSLEEAGVHVVYGIVGLKTHCKVALIVRKEKDRIVRYLHLGTGNYNPGTARIYTDFSLLTAREDLASDVSELFNHLTGYSHQKQYKKLLVAPVNMREKLTALINREAQHAKSGRPARLIFKMNALVDPQMISSLYEASRAGVQIDLIVRGICCLRPGIEGVSERIRVVSVVGRFLEHSRAYYFHNGGRQPCLYLGSADLMQRNLDRRVEVLFPVEDAQLRRYIRDEILEVCLNDTVQARMLRSNGEWYRILPEKPFEPFSMQDWLLTDNGAHSKSRLKPSSNGASAPRVPAPT